MKFSKFITIDDNITIEYIQDTSNLIGEEYSVSRNIDTGIYSFFSTTESTKNSIVKKQVIESGSIVTKEFTNSLVILDDSEINATRLDFEKLPNISKSDWGISPPIQYDRIRVWMPVSWTFGENKGFYIKVWTQDNNGGRVELSNYYFNISNPDRLTEIDYQSPPLYHIEKNWDKYIEIQFPSPNKISEQIRGGIIPKNSINSNLTGGVGILNGSPIFINFWTIDSISNSGGNSFFRLGGKRFISFSSDQFINRVGVVIEESKQGEFFNIYPTYGGNKGSFSRFIEDSISRGSRWNLEYQIDVFEKNIKTTTQKILVTDNFTNDIIFRPILKITTTTGAIDVTMTMIDVINGTRMSKKTSIGLLGDRINKYSKSLSRIDLTRSDLVHVIDYKPVNISGNVGGFGKIQNRLEVKIKPYQVTSNTFYISTTSTKRQSSGRVWSGLDELEIIISPFDNILSFFILNEESDLLDLTQYSEVTIEFRTDSKLISIPIWKDSDQSGENGNVVFSISSDKYNSIKSVYDESKRFYIVGKTPIGKSLIYQGSFIIWDSPQNKSNLETEYNRLLLQKSTALIKDPIDKSESVIIEEVREKIEEGTNIETSPISLPIKSIIKSPILSKVTGINTDSIKLIKGEIDNTWTPIWEGSPNVIIKAWELSRERSGRNKYSDPVDMREFAIRIRDLGLISNISVNNTTGELSLPTKSLVDLILGYFKIHDFNPTDPVILDFVVVNKGDLDKYLENSPLRSDLLVPGSNIPPIGVIEKIKTLNFIQNQFKTNPSIIKSNLDIKKPNRGR